MARFLVFVAVVCASASAIQGQSTPLLFLKSKDHIITKHNVVYDDTGSFPPPFTGELKKGDTGGTVGVFQFLVFRALNMSQHINQKFDEVTIEATQNLQVKHGLGVTGYMDLPTAQFVMSHLTRDRYVDDGQPAEALGYKYKVVIDVHQNRSIESKGRLYAGNGTLLYTFQARLHGWDACDCKKPWPDFNNSDDGLTSFASDGNTPTGLTEFDLNTPEDIPKLYGPYPVNRAVQGIRGNAKFLIPSYRNGILMHTGEWPGWQPPKPMPNSSGCIHTWPQECKHIADTLQALGIEARPNTNGKLPYPYNWREEKNHPFYMLFCVDPRAFFLFNK